MLLSYHPWYHNMVASMGIPAAAGITEQEQREKACDIYCSLMPRPRYDWLSKRTGISREKLMQWAAEGRWLQIRNERLAATAAAKKAALADEKRESAETALRATKHIVREIEQRVQGYLFNKDLKALADTLLKMRNLQTELYDELSEYASAGVEPSLVVLSPASAATGD